jgi:hypothetical protein
MSAKRPRNTYAAKKREEVPPHHSMTLPTTDEWSNFRHPWFGQMVEP